MAQDTKKLLEKLELFGDKMLHITSVICGILIPFLFIACVIGTVIKCYLEIKQLKQKYEIHNSTIGTSCIMHHATNRN